MGLAKAKSLIFHPENATNISCTTILIDLVPVWSCAILVEFDNKKQASYWNLSISESPKCFKNCKGDKKKILLGSSVWMMTRRELLLVPPRTSSVRKKLAYTMQHQYVMKNSIKAQRGHYQHITRKRMPRRIRKAYFIHSVKSTQFHHHCFYLRCSCRYSNK